MRGFVLTLSALFCFIFVLLCFSVFFVWKVDQEWSPVIEPRLRERQKLSSIRVTAKNAQGESQWVGSITSGRLEERNFVTLGNVPPLLVQSILVLEDPRFLDHGGFDLFGILRAAVKNVVRFRYAQGGSTITQQLVKNVFLTREKTIKRKFTELILAALVEKRFTKDEILEAYFNEVYLGQLGPIEIHGVSRASEYYFGKKVTELEVHEMALLAAMIAGPGIYSPWKSQERTKNRRNKVLKLLAENNFILPEELIIALEKPLPTSSRFVAPTRAAYLIDALREELLESWGEQDLLRGGGDVNLGIDLKLQSAAEKALLDMSAGKSPEFQGVVVAANPQTCEILAYAGGTDYRVTQLDRIRQSKRQIGSLMKPLLAYSLLQEGTVNLASQIEDSAIEWKLPGAQKSWKPENYDKKFRGAVTYRKVLEESLNVPFLKVLLDASGGGGSIVPFLAFPKLTGFQFAEDRLTPSALLGAVEQRPLDVLNAYVKLTRRSEQLTKENQDLSCKLSLQSKVLPVASAVTADAPVEIFDFQSEGARLTIAALEGAFRRGTSKSYGSKVSPLLPWAAKTGTSSDLRDSWYVALSPKLVLLGWVGRDDNEVTGLTGATGALPLLSKVMNVYGEQVKNFSWKMPGGVEWRVVDQEKLCVLNTGAAEKVKSALTMDPLSTPPPEPFEFGGRKYIYEMFSKAHTPPEC